MNRIQRQTEKYFKEKNEKELRFGRPMLPHSDKFGNGSASAGMHKLKNRRFSSLPQTLPLWHDFIERPGRRNEAKDNGRELFLEQCTTRAFPFQSAAWPAAAFWSEEKSQRSDEEELSLEAENFPRAPEILSTEKEEK